MTLKTFISNLFCKKRKEPQPSHASSPKNSSRDNSLNSSEIHESRSTSKSSQPAQDGSDDQLKDSVQTQPISESEDEVTRFEIKLSQRSNHRNGEISAVIAVSTNHKEKVVLSKGDRHERVAIFKPNNQHAQRENDKGRLQGRNENQNGIRQSNNQMNNMIGATNVQREDEMVFSDDLSYQSKASVVSLTELNQIEQRRSEIVSKEVMKKKALEDLEKFNYAAIGVTREGAMSKRYKKEKSDLYFEFCKKADVHPIEYYRNNNKKIFTKENLEERIKDLLKKDGFKTDGLIFTKEGLPHKSHTNQNIKNWLVKYGYYDVVIQNEINE